jgi:pSer/pThr/pTyr-binding forkhead associated (FHA) protein
MICTNDDQREEL